MIPETMDFHLTLRDRKTRALHALDVLLGHDRAQKQMQQMQATINAMAVEMNRLHDRLNEQTKLMRKLRVMVENDP